MISYDILQNLENNCFELLNATTGMISGYPIKLYLYD